MKRKLCKTLRKGFVFLSLSLFLPPAPEGDVEKLSKSPIERFEKRMLQIARIAFKNLLTTTCEVRDSLMTSS